MSLGPDEWTMVSPWDWTLGCTGMPYGFSNNPHPALNWEALAVMAGVNGEEERHWEERIQILPACWVGLGSKGSFLAVTDTCISRIILLQREWGPQRWVTWSQSHSKLWHRSDWDPVLLICNSKLFLFRKWWLQFSSFLGARTWTFFSDPLWILGFEESKNESECWVHQHRLV